MKTRWHQTWQVWKDIQYYANYLIARWVLQKYNIVELQMYLKIFKCYKIYVNSYVGHWIRHYLVNILNYSMLISNNAWIIIWWTITHCNWKWWMWDMQIWHLVDIMHVEKSVCDSLLRTFTRGGGNTKKKDVHVCNRWELKLIEETTCSTPTTSICKWFSNMTIFLPKSSMGVDTQWVWQGYESHKER